MANRQVPGTYRHLIDHVIAGVRLDFEEMGIEDAILAELQQQWEARLAASNVADFSTDSRMAQHSSKSTLPASQPQEQQQQQQQVTKTDRKPRKLVKTPAPEDDGIGSDLDDSDEEDLAAPIADDGADSGDLLIALYEKVTRVKNKWKVTLKDGIVNVKGKDYLFSKCLGEFEW